MTRTKKQSTEAAVREIRRKTRRKFAPEEKVRIVLEGLRGEQSVSVSRSVPKLGPPSRGPSVVVVQNTTKPFSAGNGAVHLGSGGHLLDQLVVKPLVIALLMVVLRVFLHGLAKVTLAQGDDLR